ncbi:SEC-C metal-binding domain-containing protein [Enterococcus sp. OL5]|uniref:SEC-C metal-binding domain-containing protein n=1 Tax=Enterococcus sp. OL5 TaxID=2590214 RepID=UPI00167203AF
MSDHYRYFLQGLVPHLKKFELTSITEQTKEFSGEIGRNSPCPCGSGKNIRNVV